MPSFCGTVHHFRLLFDHSKFVCVHRDSNCFFVLLDRARGRHPAGPVLSPTCSSTSGPPGVGWRVVGESPGPLVVHSAAGGCESSVSLWKDIECDPKARGADGHFASARRPAPLPTSSGEAPGGDQAAGPHGRPWTTPAHSALALGRATGQDAGTLFLSG